MDQNEPDNPPKPEPPAEEDTQPADDGESPHQSLPGSPVLSPADGDDASKPSVPIQKRRRVTRACDECRRKKIKCDGKQPCTHCTVYGYECTYDQPSNRRRNAAPHYIEALEKQLARANAILKSVLPQADLNDPELESKLRSGLIKPTGTADVQNGENSMPPPYTTPNGVDPAADSHLESMVRSTGQLDLDEQGNLEYHGQSSGLSFVKRMREQFGDMMGPEGQATPFIKSRPMSQVFDSPRSMTDSPWDHNPGIDLPPKEEARLLCDNAIEDAGSLLRVVHYPTFLKQMDDIYNIPQEHYGNSENVFLPLFYAVLALGSLFDKDNEQLDRKGYETAIAEGFKYFRLARSLMDIADCRDLRQIQALVYMIMFLQSSAKLSTCYAYIGVALRSALRMGLHRSFSDSFAPIESENRKRLFWVIQRMDTYVGALLGLPHSLSEDDIDQEYPAEVDDVYITAEGIVRQPEGTISTMAAANAHSSLIKILDKIVRYVYPLKGSGTTAHGKAVKSYSVSYAKILEIERDLKQWQDRLPMGLKPGGEAPTVIIRVQHLLRMAYAHAQMMLYRPFLHYVSHTCKSRVIDKRSYACAAACVSVSRNIIHIACEMKRRGLLVGAYWFTMYTTFFAILSLVFYALENPDNDACQDVLRVATEGKDTLEQLAGRSMAADRCSATLQALFEQLPERISRTRRNSMLAKKRKQDSDMPKSAHPDNRMPENMPPIRASTFPHSRSRSVDRRTAFISPSEAAQRSSAMGFPNANTNNFYDLSHSKPDTNSATPASAGMQQNQNSMTSPGMNQSNFQLADLSAMMFPSNDPVAYPNSADTPAQSYDDIIKSLANDPMFQFPDTLDEYRMQRSAGNGNFVPPSSTFMYNSGEVNDQNQMYDNDVALLGPMPAYMMQGPSFNRGGQNSNAAACSTNTASDGGSLNTQLNSPIPTNLFLSPGGPTNTAAPTANTQNAMANVNLDQLLGGEEWSGLSTNSGYASMGHMFGPLGFQNSSTGGGDVKMGNTTSGAENGMQGIDTEMAMGGPGTSTGNGFNKGKVGSRAVTFDDLNPGVLGWNLDGY